MRIEEFRELAKKLGLKTGSNLEKVMDFENNGDTPAEKSAISQAEPPSFSDYEIAEGDFSLPVNYTNKYNLERGDYAALSLEEALTKSLTRFGRVDVEYISSLSLLSLKDVILGLGRKIYKDPANAGEYFYQGYVSAEEYLSGNVMRKYEEALAASKVDPIYRKNVLALSNLLPPKPSFGEFFVGLGTPWLPPSYVAEFVQYLYRVSLVRNKRICEVFYERSIHRWIVVLNVDVRSTVIASKTYGTERMDMFKILEKTLNHEQIRITDADPTGEKKGRRINREQTMLAEEKRQMLKDAFIRWLGEISQAQKDELCDIYYRKFCCFKSREFKKESLPLSQPLGGGVQLYDYQRAATNRILTTQSTLLAHDVGAGKTYAMVVAAHEIAALNKGAKNMIVVPNSILAQWAEDYRLLYPDARILVVTPNDFSPEKRGATLDLMRYGDHESILLSYSTFELIECGTLNAQDVCRKKIEQIDMALADNSRRRVAVKNKIATALQKEREDVLERLRRLDRHERELENTVTFEQMKITALFIDEAHNYKNLPLESSLGNIKGINVEGSKKCADVYDKAKSVLALGGKVVFATGTPVTNSVADIFVMQKYLSEDVLAFCDLDFFDNWAGTFGEITRSYEIDVDTEGYRLTTRFNKFNNLKELSVMINKFTDFHVAGRDGLPEVERVHTVVVEKTQTQKDMLSEISDRVEKIRAGEVDRKEDNLLKVTTDGRKLALDARLIDENCAGLGGNKIPACAQEVAKLYHAFPGKTQLVFSDIGTPKVGYNVYDHLKDWLITLGVNGEEVGFVHDATSDLRRAKLFESVNNGTIRILIGSTFKLGTGVNVQERLIAIHHLDVPWRPSDMVQREGRLVRRGNTNEKVFIYRYVTDGSFDAYSWQLLENKQRFITELLTGTAKGADERRLDDAVLSYAEVKALAVGNPLVKERVETVNEIARVKMLLREEEKKLEEMDTLRRLLPDEIKEEKARLLALRADVRSWDIYGEIADKAVIGELISKTINENAMCSREIFITTVNGFKLYLPANFNKIRPYLVLEGRTRHTVDINTFAVGAVVKIENFMCNLKEAAKHLSQKIDGLEMQLKQASAPAVYAENYSAQIEELSSRLKEIDKQLGL